MGDARATSLGFWEHARLYMQARGVKLTSASALMREALDLGTGAAATVPVWKGQVIMNDNEMMRVDWFAGGAYWDWFSYIDALQKMWTHRWGDHAVRTFGVAMHMEDAKVEQLRLPY